MAARRVVIVGGVAGGMSAATRLRRLDETASITVVERSGHVSYANCGLPYFVGGVIEDEDDLFLQTPERLFERFRLDVRVGTEVVGIDPVARTVSAVATGGAPGPGGARETLLLPYDVLILSPGAAPVRPPLPGFDRVRVLRTVEDAERLTNDARRAPRTAVVIGAGFVGLETAENLARRGISTTIVEMAPQVLTALDPEMAVEIAAEFVSHGVTVLTGTGVAEVTGEGVVLTDARRVPAELVVAALGVRPDVRLAEMAGLAVGPHGGIVVDGDGATSDPDIYAVGDAVEKVDVVGGGFSLIALANIANRQGRRVADRIAGLSTRPARSQGTAIVKVFDRTAAITGWSERRLRAAERPYRVLRSHPMNHASYYPGAEPMSLKLLFDPADGTILGAQAVGGAGVDKRIDVLATAMAAGLPADALADLELAYAPPFSSAKDPVNMLGYMAENLMSGECDVAETEDVERLVSAGWTLLDVRSEREHARGAIPGGLNIPLDSLRERLDTAGPGPFLVYCEVGQRGHTATMLLHDLGVVARNLNGGYRSWRTADAAAAEQPARLVAT